MAQPYVGEVRMFGGNFAPAGWMMCEGQLVPIAENETLFNLIGTTYGGDGQSTFGLPDLRGRLPLHQGNGFVLAQTGGAESVTLSTQQLPVHNHQALGSSGNGTQPNPAGNVLSTSTLVQHFAVETVAGNLAANAVVGTGGSQPHSNMQPYLCVTFIISLFGIFPPP